MAASPQRFVVVGAGITGLTVAFLLRQRRPDAHITVLEAAPRPGGNVFSTVEDGYVVDHGPVGFQGAAEHTWRLVHALGLQDRIQTASAASSARWVWYRGRLHQAPMSPMAMLTSPLMGPLAVGRMLLEPLVPRVHHDESVHAFVSRRFGRRVAQRLAGPLVTGISAGDARHISVGGLFPALADLEEGSGSVFLGGIRRASQKPTGRAPYEAGATLNTRPNSLTTFRNGGMGTLTATLAARLGDAVRVGQRVAALDRTDRGWQVQTATGESYDADHVVLCTPTFLQAEWLAPHVPAVVNDLRGIPYAGARALALGFRKQDVPESVRGFGFLTPADAGVRILGCLFSSCIFPDQAPPHHVAMRVIAGGERDPRFVHLSDEDALEATLADLKLTLGLDATPTFVRQVRWPHAIPQYAVGHRDRVARISSLVEAQAPGVYVAGNGLRGVAVNACIQDAYALVERLAPR